MKVWKFFVGCKKPDNSAIGSSMKLFDTVLESLSHALCLVSYRFGFPSWNPEKLASKVVEFCYVCYFI